MPELRNVTVLADAAAVAAAVADDVIATLAAALSVRERAHMALAGGSTPRSVNALLVAEPRRSMIDWSRVTFWFGDERCVAPDSDQSNFRMNSETLLGPLGIDAAHVHRMHGEDDPETAAAAYDTLLQREIGPDMRLDLLMLGMGPDGHTASLFPGTLAAIDESKYCIAHFVPKLNMWRMTLTPRAINEARSIIFTAGGAEKADALHEVLDGARDTDLYPSQIVAPADGALHWFVDTAAAAKL